MKVSSRGFEPESDPTTTKHHRQYASMDNLSSLMSGGCLWLPDS
ncbi:hypothetical protein HanRHA438_Chr04g0157941 [Helianthus annuus]|nr:hypothetical protein HanRHA438_Chr04g0157941 [Helianthus annuus]